LRSADPLDFEDRKKYTQRLAEVEKKTGLKDAITTVYGKVDGQDLVVASMNLSLLEAPWALL
jgi:acetyl-CoA carboxylase carboxyl transferase subunit beta